MKALIIQDMKRLGGGRRSSFIFADVFREMGYDAYFLTNLDGGIGEKNRVAFKVDYEFRENEPMLSSFYKILKLKRQLKKVNVSEYDITLNHHPNVFIIKGDVNVLHGFSFLDPWIDENGNIIKKIPPVGLKMINIYGEYNGGFFTPNSRYTAALARKLLPEMGIEGKIGDVLHPPILYRQYEHCEKKRQMIVIGRLNWSKGMEDAVNIANSTGEKTIIAGFMNKGDEEYVESLKRRAGDSVEIRPNISEDEKKALMMESSTIISLNRKENFGISTVEAMNYGCVPIVPKSGGQWIDIVEEGKYGLGFSDYGEIPELAGKSFECGEKERRRIAESVERFSMQVFTAKLKKIVENVTASRR